MCNIRFMKMTNHGTTNSDNNKMLYVFQMIVTLYIFKINSTK